MPEQIHETFIRTTPERLWSAMTDPGQTQQYFFGSFVRSRWEVGAPIVFTAGAEGPTMVDGEIEAIEPQQRLQHTWTIRYEPSLGIERSRVTYTLEPRGENVELTVRHELHEAPRSAEHLRSDAWSVVLSSLESLLETGRPLALPPQG